MTLPLLMPALVSAFLIAFTLSFDEFAIASFLAGTQPTWPVYLFAQLRVPSQLPQLIAVSSVVLIASRCSWCSPPRSAAGSPSAGTGANCGPRHEPARVGARPEAAQIRGNVTIPDTATISTATAIPAAVMRTARYLKRCAIATRNSTVASSTV